MKALLNTLLPVNSHQRMFVRLLLEIARAPGSWRGRLSRENFANFRRYRGHEFRCPVCGKVAKALYDFPDVRLRREHRVGVLRETLQCRGCFAPMRERSLAHALLQHLNQRWGTSLDSIAELARHGLRGLRLLDTDNFSATSLLLRGVAGVTRCSYVPSEPWGKELAPGYFNIDLERIDFAGESFDVLLTSDVMEHVRDCEAAHREIHRVLKPGGAYIFNVPYEETSERHIVLVDTSTGKDIYLVPPQLHGDPLTGGILAYRVFGRELLDTLQHIGFEVRFMRLQLPERLIVDGDVFVACKTGDRS
jgi:SAM-dependent methyltransferase